MKAEANTNKHTDPTAVALLLEQHTQSEEASRFYRMALERNHSTALAHTRLGRLQLMASATSENTIDVASLNDAMGHLLHGAIAGFREAENTLEHAGNISTKPVSDKARFHLATLSLTREISGKSGVNPLDEFTSAVDRLEDLVLNAADPNDRTAALKQLNRRRKNGSQIFHTQDETIYNQSQKAFDAYLTCVRDGKKPPKGEAAYELGKKMLYGAAGMPQHVQHAMDLLKSAAKDGVKNAQVHLDAFESGTTSNG